MAHAARLGRLVTVLVPSIRSRHSVAVIAAARAPLATPLLTLSMVIIGLPSSSTEVICLRYSSLCPPSGITAAWRPIVVRPTASFNSPFPLPGSGASTCGSFLWMAVATGVDSMQLSHKTRRIAGNPKAHCPFVWMVVWMAGVLRAWRGQQKPRNRLRVNGFGMVSPAGFEPATPGLEVPRSIH